MKSIVGVLTFALFVAGSASAQQNQLPDTLRHYELDTIVITANRVPTAIRSSVSAVSVIDRRVIDKSPTPKVSDILEMIPGFAFLSLDALGYEPQATVRGFYGGGEAEYVTLLIDGRPVNSIERGLINWNLLDALNIESVEAVRGSVSSLYGDVAVGGVINVRTRPSQPATFVRVSGGSYGTLEGSGVHTGRVGKRFYSLSAGGARTAGYRDHADRQVLNLGSSATVVNNGTTSLDVLTRHHWKNVDVPGPVAAQPPVGEDRRTTSSPIYRFDHLEESFQQASLVAAHTITEVNVSADITGRVRSVDEIRTLELFPGFGDTQNRDAMSYGLSGRLMASKQFTTGIPARVTLGADGSYGRLDNSYFTLFTGPIDDYASAGDVSRGDLESKSIINRLTGAAYAQIEVTAIESVRLSGGVRLDAIEDSFDPRVAGEEVVESTTTHTAVSPRVGANVRVITSQHHTGNVYGSVSRTFKTPTLDQLYDQRQIPFGEFSIKLANDMLDPQSGVGFEAGYYHSFASPGGIQVEGSVAVYQIDMTNEIDFDLQTFTYTNLGESRHRGVELGLSAEYKRFRAFSNYTMQDVELQFGENDGNAVKAIPRNLLVAGASIDHSSGLGGSFDWRRAADIFLDDANTIRLPAYDTVDGKVFYTRGDVTASVTVTNLLGETYSSTGFPLADLEGGSQIFVYPAAGRQVLAGIAMRVR